MKIGIISDTHGHEMAWANACERFFKGADLILHAGDVLYHGPRNPMKADYNPAGLVARINSCDIPVVIAKGNCDSSVDASCLDLPIEAPYAYVVWEGLRIVVTHGGWLSAALWLGRGTATPPRSEDWPAAPRHGAHVELQR